MSGEVLSLKLDITWTAIRLILLHGNEYSPT